MQNNHLLDFFNFIITSPDLKGRAVTNKKNIDYGMQFGLDGNVIRIYESKKKGLTLDTSQCKDEILASQLLGIYDKYNGNTVPDFSHSSPMIYPLMNPPLTGSDEVGKGDYFTPLIVAGVFLTENEYNILATLGVRDSKLLSDSNIQKLSAEIKNVTTNYSIVKISQKKYNELYEKVKNINIILAWAHTQAIKNLCEQISFNNVLIDQFGREDYINNKLLEINPNFNIKFAAKAEQNLAVAAASILARNELLCTVDKMNKYYNMTFPLGASNMVIKTGKEFIKKYSTPELPTIAKIHFKTTNEILK